MKYLKRFNESSDYKFCRECGTKLEKDSAFCGECGEKQESPNANGIQGILKYIHNGV